MIDTKKRNLFRIAALAAVASTTVLVAAPGAGPEASALRAPYSPIRPACWAMIPFENAPGVRASASK